MTVLIDEGTELGNGRYALQSKLGTGGAAIVWLAEDTVLERAVAVKVLSEALASDESWLARFRREARLAARLSHPNLVSVYDFAAGPDRPYIVMEHMEGGSLWDLMQAGDAVDSDLLARDLLSALEVIHAAGIVHRDIKPGNVLFASDGTACLTDFGVARPEDATSLTQTGQIPGTARFMAPELWTGQPADERTDLYAAGVLLGQVANDDASPSLLNLIESLAAEDAEGRPASANAALKMLKSKEPARTGPVPARQPASEPTTRTIIITSNDRSRRLMAIVGVAILAVVAVIALTNAIGGEDDPARSDSGASTASRDSGGSGSGNGSGGHDDANESDPGTDQGIPPEEPIDPVALDQQGKALIDQGDPESAVPILQRAVDYYPEDSQDIQYAYSLYNLGNALYLTGRAEEAIPYLEKRLEFDDQRGTVQSLLNEALKAAGGEPGKPKKLKPEKP
jgi:serine/threonine protein kinase